MFTSKSIVSSYSAHADWLS